MIKKYKNSAFASIITFSVLSLIDKFSQTNDLLKQWPRKWRGDIPTKMNQNLAKTILNVPAFASREQIQKNYIELLKKNHPDRGGSVYVSQLLTEAVNTLQQ